MWGKAVDRVVGLMHDLSASSKQSQAPAARMSLSCAMVISLETGPIVRRAIRAMRLPPASNSAAFCDGMGFDFGQSLPVDQRTDRHSGAKPSPTISGGLSPRTLDKHLRERLTGRG